MTKGDKLDDLGGEAKPSIGDSLPRFAQPAYGFAKAFIDSGLINRWVIWSLIAIFALHALPDNSLVNFNFHTTEKTSSQPDTEDSGTTKSAVEEGK